jgi:hypothetical protein
MAKRKTVQKKIFDFGSWNFILFLTLALILLVTMLSAMTSVSTDVRSKAGLICPKVTLPRAEDCPTGWKYQRDATNGCPTFLCTAK